MKVHDYNRLVAPSSRRGVLKGAAGSAALALASGGALGPCRGPRAPRPTCAPRS